MANLEPGEMMIGDLARKLGMTTATINFYVTEGVLPPPRKLSRTRAAYSDRHRRILEVVRRCKNNLRLPLARIRELLQFYGTDDEGLATLESIGSLRAPAPAWGADRQPVEPFDPEPLDAFAARTGSSPEVIEQLEAWGLLRPREPGLYDAVDAALLKTVQALLSDGVALDRLAYHRELVAPLHDAANVLHHLVLRHVDELRGRELRVRDLFAALTQLQEYMLDRIKDEQAPDWRAVFTTNPPDAPRGED